MLGRLNTGQRIGDLTSLTRAPVRMNTQSTKNSSVNGATTAPYLEARCDAGDDVLHYSDVTRATVSLGGASQVGSQADRQTEHDW